MYENTDNDSTVLRHVVDSIADEVYMAFPEGEEALRKIANAFNQMHAAAAQKDLREMLNHAEKEEVAYADNRAGRRAQAKAQKTRGSKQRKLDKRAANWYTKKG